MTDKTRRVVFAAKARTFHEAPAETPGVTYCGRRVPASAFDRPVRDARPLCRACSVGRTKPERSMPVFDPAYMARIAEIRRRRELIRMSSDELGRRCGLHGARILQIEAGQLKTRASSLVAMESALEAAEGRVGEWRQTLSFPPGLRWIDVPERVNGMTVRYAIDPAAEYVYRRTGGAEGGRVLEKCDLRGTRRYVRHLSRADAEREAKSRPAKARILADLPELVSIKEMAAAAGVTGAYLRERFRASWEPERLRAGRRTLYRREEVRKWLAEVGGRGSIPDSARRKNP